MVKVSLSAPELMMVKPPPKIPKLTAVPGLLAMFKFLMVLLVAPAPKPKLVTFITVAYVPVLVFFTVRLRLAVPLLEPSMVV